MMSRLLVALLLMTVLVAPVQAATYYVAPSGQGSCSTNRNTPQGGINNGLSCLAAGDTLIALSGTYNEAIWGCNAGHPCIPNGINESQPTIVKSDVQHSAVLRPPEAASFGHMGVVIDADMSNDLSLAPLHDIIFDGFRIDMSQLQCSFSTGLRVHGQQVGRVIIQNNDIGNPCGQGTVSGPNGITGAVHTLSGAAYSVLYKSNIIHDLVYPPIDSAEDQAMGVYLVGANQILDGNTIYNVAGYCGETWAAGSLNDAFGVVRNDNVIYRNNYCHHSGGRGFLFSAGNNMQMYNNVLVSTGTGTSSRVAISPASAGQGSSGTKVFNNTVYGNNGECITIEGGQSNVQVFNNICWDNGNDAIKDFGVSSTINNNLCQGFECVLYANPQFANPGAGDFHLTSGSPEQVKTGGANLSSTFTTDHDNNQRSAPWSLGAYEFGAGGLPAPTNPRLISITP